MEFPFHIYSALAKKGEIKMKSMNLFENSKSRENNKPKRKEHSKEFKELAVNLASKIGVTKAAEELGVSTSSIYSWNKILNTSISAKKLPPAPIQDANDNITFELEGKIYSLNVNSEKERERVKEEVNANSLAKYDWFKEETGEKHWVFYNTEMYEIEQTYTHDKYIHYKENSNLDPVIPVNATSCYHMFSFCKTLIQLDHSSFNNINITTVEQMFYYCEKLNQLNISNFDTSQVINMCGMFYGCTALTELNLSNFNTSNVISMRSMFDNCKALTQLDLSNFDTSHVTDMYAMFNGCEALTQLDLSNFDTSKVIYMTYMFSCCLRLTQLDLSSFDTSKVTTMCGMFSLCVKFTTLDLSNFNTSNVTDMRSMFEYCLSLTQLDISSFDISNIIHIVKMFATCKKLTTIYISNKWNVNSVKYSDDIFKECYSLPNFSPEKTDAEMSKPVEDGGYLTLKK